VRAGVTGTQHGWTEAQRIQFTLMVSEMDITEWHHGDCEGVDDQASKVVSRRFSSNILHSHPPDNPKKRAYIPSGTTYYPPIPYLERNKDIAHAVEVLFVIPKVYTEKEAPRSGTWHTYREATKLGRRIILILPSGEVE